MSQASRLPYLNEDQLDDDARRVWDDITSGKRGSKADLTTPEGGLVGPFNALVHARRVGEYVAKLGEVLRFDGSLDPQLREMATVTVGVHWKAEFEIWAHSRLARAAGVADEIVDALTRGETPEFADATQTTVHRVTRELLETGQVGDDTYEAAVEALGYQGVTELVALVGYYSLVSFTLNAFRVPVPSASA